MQNMVTKGGRGQCTHEEGWLQNNTLHCNQQNVCSALNRRDLYLGSQADWGCINAHLGSRNMVILEGEGSALIRRIAVRSYQGL